MTTTPDLRPISPMNTNYNPPRPWVCGTMERHDCDGIIVGSMGVAVCAAGAVAEQAAWDRSNAWAEAYLASPAGRAEIAAEHAWEARVS